MDLTSLDRKCEDVLVLQFDTLSGSLVAEFQTGSSSSGSGVTVCGVTVCGVTVSGVTVLGVTVSGFWDVEV